MSKQLSDRQQRFVFGAVVVTLVAFGIYLSMGGPGDRTAEEEAPEPVPEAAQPAEEGAPAEPPAPIEVTGESDLDVSDWFPFPEEEILEAALIAREFAAAYGTYEHGESEDAYYERLAGLAAEDFAETLPQASGAGALRGEMAEAETTATGRAEITAIRAFDDDSIIFLLTAQSIAEGAEGVQEDLGEFAVTAAREGGEWRVYDFQPADSGNLGEE